MLLVAMLSLKFTVRQVSTVFINLTKIISEASQNYKWHINMAEIHSPHDKLARQSLANIEVAKDFLATHIPKHILAKFDLNNIELSNRTYIDPQLTEQ